MTRKNWAYILLKDLVWVFKEICIMETKWKIILKDDKASFMKINLFWKLM